MKKKTDFRARLRAVKKESEKALCLALLARGGSCTWGEPHPEDPEDTSGDTCCPVITGSYKHADITEEYTVYKAVADAKYGCVRLYGYPRDGGFRCLFGSEEEDYIYYTDYDSFIDILDALPFKTADEI